MDNKTQLRQRMRVALNSQNWEDRIMKSKNIQQQLVQSDYFDQFFSILFYVPLTTEVLTDGLINHCLRIPKKVFIPKVESKQLVFREMKTWSDLEFGLWGIKEPKKHCPAFEMLNLSERSLIVVPSLAVDRQGHRLGRGLGYYDRFLEKHPNLWKISIVYGTQLIEHVPYEKHDIPMDEIITENGTIRINSN